MATKSSEHCENGFYNPPMMDYDSDGLISRQEIMKYLVKRNASENTMINNEYMINESNKMLMTFRTKFNDIDENKDGYISSHELDNVNRYT
jgi:Ca2+-binding EF-hand superfamily protein